MNTRVRLAMGTLALLSVGMALEAATIPSGTPVRVRLQQSLSSKDAKSGQEFTAVLDQALTANGTTIPKGANVRGIVAKAVPSGRLSTTGELYLRLTSVEVDGRSYPLETDTIGTRGKSHKKRDEVAIGGGSVLGAIIGAIAGGGKGAAVGAAAGAGAGTAGAAATGKKDIEYAVETPLTFRLRRAVTVP